jgi:putative flippase GtrA
LGAGFARGTIQVPQLRGPSFTARRNGAQPAEFSRLPLQIARFAIIGAGSTLAYLGLYLLLRGSMPAQGANLISLLLTAVANTAANRRLTFGISGRPNVARHQFKGLLTFGIGLALTAGSLAALHASSPHPGRGTEIVVLLAANMVAAALRFALYRNWVFGRSKRRAGWLPAETDDSARGEPARPSPVEPFGSTVQLAAMTATTGEH